MFIKLTTKSGHVFVNPDKIHQIEVIDDLEVAKTKIHYNGVRGDEVDEYTYVIETPEEIIVIVDNATPSQYSGR